MKDMIRKNNKGSLIYFVLGLISFMIIISSSFIGDYLEKISYGNMLLVIGFISYITVLMFSVIYLRFQVILKLIIAWCFIFIISHYIIFRVLFPNIIPDIDTRPSIALKESLWLLLGVILFSIGVMIIFFLLKRMIVAIKNRKQS
jgi:hypothetical protein